MYSAADLHSDDDEDYSGQKEAEKSLEEKAKKLEFCNTKIQEIFNRYDTKKLGYLEKEHLSKILKGMWKKILEANTLEKDDDSYGEEMVFFSGVDLDNIDKLNDKEKKQYEKYMTEEYNSFTQHGKVKITVDVFRTAIYLFCDKFKLPKSEISLSYL